MFSRKISGIILIIALAAGISITTTRCYDDNDKEARVTIHLERNDLAAMGIQPQKHFIDRVLEFFSTRAEAGGWQDTKTNPLTLTVSSSTSSDIVFTIPAGATTYTVTIPSGYNIKFTIKHKYTDMGYGDQNNWGAQTTVNLGPGDQDINLKMIPMTFIISVLQSASITLSWQTITHISAASYRVYRSTSIDGDYVFFGTSTNGGGYTGTRYYYKVSCVTTSGEEGVMSDPKTWL